MMDTINGAPTEAVLPQREMSFMPVEANDLKGKFDQIMPQNCKGVKETWKYVDGKWNNVQTDEIRMAGTQVNEEGGCEVEYSSGVSDPKTDTYQPANSESAVAWHDINNDSQEIQIRGMDENGTPKVDRFYRTVDMNQ